MTTSPEARAAAPAPSQSDGVRSLRVAVVGISTTPICGVRDHARVLAEALGDEGVSCSMHWLDRSEQTLGASRAEIRSWARALAAELDRERPDAVLLHYSVFSYSHRGMPLFVAPALAATRRPGRPLITLLHEFAYPWGRGGARGAAWAISQRALLFSVMRASAAALVTTDARAGWLASRSWLPRRPLAVAPVFSNVPPASAAAPASGGPAPDGGLPLIGLFGYAHEGSELRVVLEALRLLAERGRTARLWLIGAPGRSSEDGERWLEQARSRGVEQALSFSGTLPAQDISDALAACEVLLFADGSGPTSRKTTLAASLASGRAVVATDGPAGWPELITAGAVELVPPSASALADALESLLDDEGMRDALAARGRAFAERRMSAASSARIATALLHEALERPARR